MPFMLHDGGTMNNKGSNDCSILGDEGRHGSGDVEYLFTDT